MLSALDRLLPQMIRLPGLVIPLVKNALKRRIWPSTEGILESYEIKKLYVIARISYTVEGEKYSLIDEWEMGDFKNRTFAEELARKVIEYRYIERDIRINYNPKNPQNAIVSYVETA